MYHTLEKRLTLLYKCIGIKRKGYRVEEMPNYNKQTSDTKREQ